MLIDVTTAFLPLSTLELVMHEFWENYLQNTKILQVY